MDRRDPPKGDAIKAKISRHQATGQRPDDAGVRRLAQAVHAQAGPGRRRRPDEAVIERLSAAVKAQVNKP